MKIMEISLAVAEEKQDKWYDEGHFKSMLTSRLEEGRYLQCRYEGNILILSEDAKAVFDESGNMLEIYDLKRDAQKNLAGRKEAAELEFEMILLLSKFNME